MKENIVIGLVLYFGLGLLLGIAADDPRLSMRQRIKCFLRNTAVWPLYWWDEVTNDREGQDEL